ncbi:MAG: MBL fold metallo-hydrolase [Propionicimonas sp.]|uniref:MBL fold metallo-hydrolase n=1 Tax=Propionicimonas sp. TaxID=1955623 RepID=UPI003D11A9F6
MEKIELPGLVLRRIAVGGMDNNVYLITAGDGAQLLVDAAAEPDAIEALLDAASPDAPEPRLRYLLTTHSHHDHIGALAAVASAHPEAEVVAGDADADAITAGTGVRVTRRLRDGDTLVLGDLELAVIGLRGHTPGSVAVALTPSGAPAQLVTGDSLFPGGVGNTGRDPQRFARLFADVVDRVFDRYPDDTVVWPGHGLPTTLGAERPHLAEWAARGW